jgi:hypothetical protein
MCESTDPTIRRDRANSLTVQLMDLRASCEMKQRLLRSIEQEVATLQLPAITSRTRRAACQRALRHLRVLQAEHGDEREALDLPAEQLERPRRALSRDGYRVASSPRALDRAADRER